MSDETMSYDTYELAHVEATPLLDAIAWRLNLIGGKYVKAVPMDVIDEAASIVSLIDEFRAHGGDKQ